MDLEKEVLKFKQGNQDAFTKLYNETKYLVQFAIYTHVPNRHIVEDLVQDTYMKVAQMIDSYTSKSFRSWIYNIAKNLALDYVKKKKEIQLEEAYEALDVKSTHPYLYYSIRHLDKLEREVFLMKVLCGHTTKRVAEILRISPSEVNQLYTLAKSKLKKSLEEKNNEA